MWDTANNGSQNSSDWVNKMYIERVISRGKGFDVSRCCLYKMQQAQWQFVAFLCVNGNRNFYDYGVIYSTVSSSTIHA